MRRICFRSGLFLLASAALFSVSCEEHHVGEYPEVQRDRLAEAKSARNQHEAATAPSPTPANFFPEKKSP